MQLEDYLIEKLFSNGQLDKEMDALADKVKDAINKVSVPALTNSISIALEDNVGTFVEQISDELKNGAEGISEHAYDLITDEMSNGKFAKTVTDKVIKAFN